VPATSTRRARRSGASHARWVRTRARPPIAVGSQQARQQAEVGALAREVVHRVRVGALELGVELGRQQRGDDGQLDVAQGRGAQQGGQARQAGR
jgi:hypothetical protein